MSYIAKLERYMLLLKSPACTPFWRQWIINKMCDLHLIHN